MRTLTPFHPDLILFGKAECHAMEAAARFNAQKLHALYGEIGAQEEISKVSNIFRNTVRLGFVPHLMKGNTAGILRNLAALELAQLEQRADDALLQCGCTALAHRKIIELVLKKLSREKFSH